MPPNHINKFTPRSLDIAMTAAGFCVLQTRYEPWSLRKVSSSIYSRVHGQLRFKYAHTFAENLSVYRIWKT